jgi:hypothetical protein
MPDVWRRCGSTYLNGKDTPSQVGDEIIGQWSEQQLMRMNARFVERLERPIANGQERPAIADPWPPSPARGPSPTCLVNVRLGKPSRVRCRARQAISPAWQDSNS